MQEGSEATGYKGSRKCTEYSYVGDMTIKGVPHGSGEITLANGDKYTGAFSSGLYHGKGQMLYANNDQIVGEWAKGALVAKKEQVIGEQKISFKEGDEAKAYKGTIQAKQFTYEGTINIKSQPHGTGSTTFADCSKHEGLYDQGSMHGKGKYSFQKNIWFIGFWDHGVLQKKTEIQQE